MSTGAWVSYPIHRDYPPDSACVFRSELAALRHALGQGTGWEVRFVEWGRSIEESGTSIPRTKKKAGA